MRNAFRETYEHHTHTEATMRRSTALPPPGPVASSRSAYGMWAGPASAAAAGQKSAVKFCTDPVKNEPRKRQQDTRSPETTHDQERPLACTGSNAGQFFMKSTKTLQQFGCEPVGATFFARECHTLLESRRLKPHHPTKKSQMEKEKHKNPAENPEKSADDQDFKLSLEDVRLAFALFRKAAPIGWGKWGIDTSAFFAHLVACDTTSLSRNFEAYPLQVAPEARASQDVATKKQRDLAFPAPEINRIPVKIGARQENARKNRRQHPPVLGNFRKGGKLPRAERQEKQRETPPNLSTFSVSRLQATR